MFMARMKTSIRSLLRCDFARREDGVIALEAMIMMPLLFWTFLALFSIFDTFRIYAANQKAAFTVSDAISRETIVCSCKTSCAACTMGSMVKCGLAPCPPTPYMVTSTLSTLAITGPTP